MGYPICGLDRSVDGAPIRASHQALSYPTTDESMDLADHWRQCRLGTNYSCRVLSTNVHELNIKPFSCIALSVACINTPI